MTMTKKMQHQIVALFPQTGVIDLSSVPSSVTAITLSPRDIIELLDACVTETAGQERRLEKIKGGPVPKYQWIEMKREQR